MDLNGAFTYTSAADFVGTETFTYTISDGTLTDDANVTFTVSADNTSGLPVLDGLVAQLESDLNVITAPDNNDAIVTEWLSVAGTNMDLVASGDPTLVENATPSGEAAISLDGEGDWLERINLSPELPVGDAPRSIYFVVDYKAIGNFAGVSYGTGASNQAFGLVLNGGNGNLTVQGFGGGNDLITTEDGIGNNDGSTGDDWFVHSVRYDGTTIKHYKDDVLIDEMDRSDFATVFSRFVIGEEIAGAGNGEELDVAAVLVYNKEVDDVEHGEILQYLTNKYLDDLQGGNTDPVAVDDPAIGDEDSFMTDEDSSFITGNVLANDSDVDAGDILVVDSFDVTSIKGGTVSYNDDGTFDFDPSGQFEVLDDNETDTDTFTYTISDGNGGFDTATVTITISGVTDVIGGNNNPVIAGLIASYESDSGISSDSGTITGWSDGSGSTNRYDLIGVNGDPQLAAGGAPSGLDAISFDGTGDFLRISGPQNVSGLPEGSSPRTLFFVVDYKTAGEFTGLAYGDNQENQAFGLVTDADELLVIEGLGRRHQKVRCRRGQYLGLDGTVGNFGRTEL